MNRACTLVLPLLGVLLAVPAWAVPPADSPAGPVTLSGSYLVTFNIRMGAPMPAGGAVLCRAHLAPNLGALQNPGRAAMLPETATGLADIHGSIATCAVQVPFSWQVGNARNSAALSYEIDAIDGPGAQPYPVRTQLGIGVPYPAPNSKESLQIDVVF